MRSKIILMCVTGLAAFIATVAGVLGSDAAQLLIRPDLAAILVAGGAGIVAIGGGIAAAMTSTTQPSTEITPPGTPPHDPGDRTVALLVRRVRALEEEMSALRHASSTTDERLVLLERIPDTSHDNADRQIALLHGSGMSAGDIASHLHLDGAETRLRMQLLDVRNPAAETRS